ncbi:MAG: T9SS type A sorting domain-containing protein [Chitinophagales bacterium]|nr:T9SS type A sorting domain-containing protein [Chitinophagales bacterium]
MKQIFLITLLALSSSAQAQLVNSGFENWTMVGSTNRLDGWMHMVGFSQNPGPNFFGTWRADTAAVGTHALRLSRWYNYTCDWIRQIAPVNARPYGISGLYKYEETELHGGNQDSALVEMVLTKWNATTLKPDTVGTGVKMLLAASTFTPFNCPVTYTSADVPDTAIISMRPMPWGSPHINMTGWGSYLTVDDISFQERSTAVKELTANNLQVYPNPVANKLYVNTDTKATACITDMTGKVLQTTIVDNNSGIDVSRLQPGNYLLTIDGADKQVVKFVKE